MITRIKKIIIAVCFTLPTVCLLCLFPVSVATVLSAGLVMEENYTPGLGRPVGIVQQVQGEVVIMHSDVLKGYKAVRGLRLYKGDTIRTLENGRIRFKLNDGSILSLASETKLKLTKSVYNKKKKRRSSFFQMALGKARFLVVKVLNFKRSEFKVKTPTAVCGVRGSDFIIEATGTDTIATALVDTELEFQSIAFLEEPPVILRDFESSSTKSGKRPSPAMRMPQDRIIEKTDQFIDVTPEKGTFTDEEDPDQGGVDDDTGVDEVGDLGGQMTLDDILPGDGGDRRGFDDDQKQIKPWIPSEIDTIKESVTEEGISGELPAFPDLPQ